MNDFSYYFPPGAACGFICIGQQRNGWRDTENSRQVRESVLSPARTLLLMEPLPDLKRRWSDSNFCLEIFLLGCVYLFERVGMRAKAVTRAVAMQKRHRFGSRGEALDLPGV